MTAAEIRAGFRNGSRMCQKTCGIARAEIEGRLFLRAVEALQARHDDQQAIGGNEAGLAEDRQDDALVEIGLGEIREAHHVLPEDHRRNADDDAGRQHRRNGDEIKDAAGAVIDLAHHDCGREADRHRNRDHAEADDDRILACRPSWRGGSTASRTNRA